MYTIQNICAVIVSYNDADAIASNISTIIEQTDRVIIMDNGSESSCVCKLKELEKTYNITVFYDDQNRGIGYQLNKALDFCTRNNYKLLLTMDQDTKLVDGCVEYLLSAINSDESIASVGPNREYPKWIEKGIFREEHYLITSGSIVDVQKAIGVGGYNNELFIDMVDVDFSLALRSKGYLVGIATNAQMIHKVGEKENNVIMGIKKEYLTHRPERYYYIYRNRQIVCRKYFRKMPTYCILMWLELLKESFGVVLEKQAKEKIHFAYKGFKDGIRFPVRKENR